MRSRGSWKEWFCAAMWGAMWNVHAPQGNMSEQHLNRTPVPAGISFSQSYRYAVYPYPPYRNLSRQAGFPVGGWTEVMRVLKASERLLEDTLRCDGERRPAKHPQDIRAQSDKIHIHIYF